MAAALLARRLARREEARAAVEERRVLLEAARRRRDAAREQAEAAGCRVGLRLPPRPADAEAAAERHAAEAESASRRRARLAELRRAVEAARREEARVAGERAELLGRLGLEDEADPGAALAALARLLPAWHERRAERDHLRRMVERLAASVPDSLRDAGKAELRDALGRAEARAAEADRLVAEVATLEQEVAEAERGDDLARARQERVAAEEAARRARRAALERAARRLLLDHLRARAAAGHLPGMTRRAARLFSRFTRGAFELRVSPSGTPLAARDAAGGEELPAARLSDATRVHLLLAARIAFVEALEAGGPRVPLLVDEALGTTDPQRFDEVGAALLELAEEGRQVLLATADPAEVARWRALCARRGRPPPRVVEVGPLPALLPDVPPPPERPPTPEPGEDLATYARRAGQGVPAPGAPADAWPVVALLADAPPSSLHVLLRRGLRACGHWRAWRSAGHPPPEGLVPGPEALDRRLALLERFVAAHWVGRGRPLGPAELAALGAISRRFLPEVARVAEECRGDPAALLAALEGGAVRRFGARRLAELRRALVDGGFLDPRPPLPDDAVEREVLGAAEAIGLAPSEARLLLRWWFLLARSGRDGPAA